MPRLRLSDGAGEVAILHAYDPALIGPWLAATLPYMLSGISAPPIHLEITPLRATPEGPYIPDWPGLGREYRLDKKGVLELLDTIRSLFPTAEAEQ